jgi:hypothetical protein
MISGGAGNRSLLKPIIALIVKGFGFVMKHLDRLRFWRMGGNWFGFEFQAGRRSRFAERSLGIAVPAMISDAVALIANG